MMKELIKCFSTPTKSKIDRFVLKSASTVDDPFTVTGSPTKVDSVTTAAPMLSADQIANLPINASGQTVNATRETAQDVYPADACIFVAK